MEAWQIQFGSNIEHGVAGHSGADAKIVTRECRAWVVRQGAADRTIGVEAKARRILGRLGVKSKPTLVRPDIERGGPPCRSSCRRSLSEGRHEDRSSGKERSPRR